MAELNHPLRLPPKQSSKPWVRISYYDFLEWLQIVDSDKLSGWETLRFKNMWEKYLIGRMFL
jgi:hypothetical protein